MRGWKLLVGILGPWSVFFEPFATGVIMLGMLTYLHDFSQALQVMQYIFPGILVGHVISLVLSLRKKGVKTLGQFRICLLGFAVELDRRKLSEQYEFSEFEEEVKLAFPDHYFFLDRNHLFLKTVDDVTYFKLTWG